MSGSRESRPESMPTLSMTTVTPLTRPVSPNRSLNRQSGRTLTRRTLSKTTSRAEMRDASAISARHQAARHEAVHHPDPIHLVMLRHRTLQPRDSFVAAPEEHMVRRTIPERRAWLVSQVLVAEEPSGVPSIHVVGVQSTHILWIISRESPVAVCFVGVTYRRKERLKLHHQECRRRLLDRLVLIVGLSWEKIAFLGPHS